MPLNHINDDDIQDFLDGHSGQWVRNHLDHCATCKESLAQYESIRERLNNDSPYQLPNNFSGKVMKQIEGERIAGSTSVFSLVLALLGIAGFGVVLFFFRGLQVLQAAAGDFIGALQSIVEALNGGLVLIAGALVTLLFLAVVDKGIVRSRHKAS